MARICIACGDEANFKWFENLYRHLVQVFGAENILGPDVFSGERGGLADRLAGCALCLVVMGPSEPGEDPHARWTRPDDPLRNLVVAALEAGCVILPVGVDGGTLPPAEALPQPLAGLTAREIHPLREESHKADLVALTHRMERELALKQVVDGAPVRRSSIHRRDLPAEDLLGRDAEARAADLFGLAHSTLSETRLAIDHQTLALEMARRQRDRPAEMIALEKLGLAYARMGETRRAIEFFEQLRPLVNERGGVRQKSELLANLGDAYAVSGQVPRAVVCYREQLGLALEVGDRAMEGAALVGLGHSYVKLGHLERAVDCYRRALERVRKGGGDPREEARLLVGLGLNYLKLDDARRAVDFLKQALALARRLGDGREETLILGDLGEAYWALDETRMAGGFFEQQAEVAAGLHQPALQAEALLRRAECYDRMGDHVRAREAAESALTCLGVQDPGLAQRIRRKLESWNNRDAGS